MESRHYNRARGNTGYELQELIMKYEVNYAIKPAMGITHKIEVETDIPEEGIFSLEFQGVVEDSIMEAQPNVELGDILIRSIKEVE